MVSILIINIHIHPILLQGEIDDEWRQFSMKKGDSEEQKMSSEIAFWRLANRLN